MPMGIESLPSLRLRRHVEPDERANLGWRALWCGVTLPAMGLAVVAQYPVVWVAERTAAAAGHCVLLADSQGTIWYGNVTLALTANGGGADATVPPSRLSWPIDMLPLLTGTLRAHLVHERALEKLITLTVTLGHRDAEAGMIALPALLLESIGAPFNTFKLDGRLRARWIPLSGQFGHGKGQLSTTQGILTIMLEQISSSLSRVRPLGSYQAVVSFSGMSGAPMQLSLSTLAGPLGLQGRGTLGLSMHFDRVVGAMPESEPQSTGLLDLLDPRDGSQHRLRF